MTLLLYLQIIISISIDLSQENCIYSLKYWLNIANSLKTELGNKFISLFVIGCKCDLLNITDGEKLMKVRELQGSLRYICLEGF